MRALARGVLRVETPALNRNADPVWPVQPNRPLLPNRQRPLSRMQVCGGVTQPRQRPEPEVSEFPRNPRVSPVAAGIASQARRGLASTQASTLKIWGIYRELPDYCEIAGKLVDENSAFNCTTAADRQGLGRLGNLERFVLCQWRCNAHANKRAEAEQTAKRP